MKKETFEQQPYGGPNITDTKTLCSNVSKTNVQITPQIAIENLQNLEKQIQKNTNRQKSLKYLYNDINDALGINNPNPSHYGEFVANHNNCTIRVSNHNAHASNYDPNNKTNISIKIRPHKNNNKFQASTDVFLKEFVYYDFMLKNDPNLVSEIIDSIIQYLSTGNFVDKSGIAYKNESPTSIAEISNRIKYNENMRRVRLTEGQLHNVIRESVNNILNEISKDKKMMSMKKARDLGRDDQAAEFADSLINDFKPYEYGNRFGDYNPSGNGTFLRNGNGLGFEDERYKDGIMNIHRDYPGSSTDSYCDYENYYTPVKDGEDYHDFSKYRSSDPRYRAAKAELDRLNNLGYK